LLVKSVQQGSRVLFHKEIEKAGYLLQENREVNDKKTKYIQSWIYFYLPIFLSGIIFPCFPWMETGNLFYDFSKNS
jgi:hypothetical protein